MKTILIMFCVIFLFPGCQEKSGSFETNAEGSTSDNVASSTKESFSKFVGTYKMDPPFDHIEISNENGDLFAKETSMPKISIMKKSEYVFIGSGATFTFVENNKDKVVGLNVLVKGKELKGVRVEASH